MNLNLERITEGLNQLRVRMGAPLISWDSGQQWHPIDPIDVDGIDISGDDVEFDTDGTITYLGRRVAVYIRDQYGSRDSEPDRLNKVHVADCSTLQHMRRQGRYERYVVTTRTDGLFSVNFLGAFGSAIRAEGVECRLYVCINCLRRLNYKNYNQCGPSEHREIRECFSLGEFYSVCNSRISILPSETDWSAPVNEYTDDWPAVRRRVRERANWRCSTCNVYLGDENMRRFLHVHHLNGLRCDNRIVNLRCLCIVCHVEEPQHQHVRYNPDYAEYLRITQNID